MADQQSPRERYSILVRPAPGASITAFNPQATNLRCPHCHRFGAFAGFANVSDISWQQTAPNIAVTTAMAGMRWCPNPECQGLVFVVWSPVGKMSYPAEMREFDADRIPAAVRECMEEAITSYAQGCYRAAAIMVRRTLESLCEDKAAVGDNLQQRLDALSARIVIPKELIEGAHELRFLGNDAAHIEAKHYQRVGKEEVDVAIDLAIELLHATYQTASLVDRLKALKGPPP